MPPAAPELSHRERVRLALEHRETDRIPIAMVCSGINPPARRALEKRLQSERRLTVDAYLAPLIDVAGIAAPYVGPPPPPGFDMWGVGRRPVSYGEGTYDEIDHYPLAGAGLTDLDRYPWPRTEWFDYEALPGRIAAANADGERCLMVSNGNIFETAWYMRGFERLFEDFVLQPDFARALLDRVADFWVEHFRAMLAAAGGAVDLAFTADDLGGQEGLLMSRAMWEEFIEPCHARLNRAIHEFGAQVIYHTDGGGGYILGPSHAIQAGTPPENILAMFDTAAGYYPFA